MSKSKKKKKTRAKKIKNRQRRINQLDNQRNQLRNEQQNKQALVERSLATLSYCAFFDIELSMAMGRAKIVQDTEMLEVLKCYKNDLKALMWTHYTSILSTQTAFAKHMNSEILKLVNNLPAELRELWSAQTKEIKEKGREALRIPNTFFEALEEAKQSGKLKVVNTANPENLNQDLMRGEPVLKEVLENSKNYNGEPKIIQRLQDEMSENELNQVIEAHETIKKETGQKPVAVLVSETDEDGDVVLRGYKDE